MRHLAIVAALAAFGSVGAAAGAGCTARNPSYTGGGGASGGDLAGGGALDLAASVVDLAGPMGACSGVQRQCSGMVASDRCEGGMFVVDRVCPASSSCAASYCAPPTAKLGTQIGARCDANGGAQQLQCMASPTAMLSCQPFVEPPTKALRWFCDSMVGQGRAGASALEGQQCRSGVCATAAGGVCFDACQRDQDCQLGGATLTCNRCRSPSRASPSRRKAAADRRLAVEPRAAQYSSPYVGGQIGWRGGRLARREEGEYLVVFNRRATKPGGMDRQPAGHKLAGSCTQGLSKTVRQPIYDCSTRLQVAASSRARSRSITDSGLFSTVTTLTSTGTPAQLLVAVGGQEHRAQPRVMASAHARAPARRRSSPASADPRSGAPPWRPRRAAPGHAGVRRQLDLEQPSSSSTSASTGRSSGSSSTTMTRRRAPSPARRRAARRRPAARAPRARPARRAASSGPTTTTTPPACSLAADRLAHARVLEVALEARRSPACAVVTRSDGRPRAPLRLRAQRHSTSTRSQRGLRQRQHLGARRHGRQIAVDEDAAAVECAQDVGSGTRSDAARSVAHRVPPSARASDQRPGSGGPVSTINEEHIIRQG